ncbi:MAG: hypothetical protein M1319_06260 [Chloroflexi bacterium]|nr:hypothetical protein [Chloroflexota bacterium]
MGKIKLVIVLLAVVASVVAGSLLAPGPNIFTGSTGRNSGVFIQYDSKAPEKLLIAGTGVTNQQASSDLKTAFPTEPEPRPFLEQILNQLGSLMAGR